MSPGLATVVRVLLDAGAAQVYGYEMMKATGFGSGKLYPILNRLERAGWVEAEFEDGDPAVLGRPRRRWYRLAGDAVEAARHELALFTQRFTPGQPVLPRLRPDGGSS